MPHVAPATLVKNIYCSPQAEAKAKAEAEAKLAAEAAERARIAVRSVPIIAHVAQVAAFKPRQTKSSQSFQFMPAIRLVHQDNP